MYKVSPRQCRYSHLVFVVTFLLLALFPFTNSLVSPGQKRDFSPSNEVFPGYSIDDDDKKNHIKRDRASDNSHLGNHNLKSPNFYTDRRQHLVALSSLVASTPWAFPDIAHASSPGTKPSTNSAMEGSKPSALSINFELSAAVQKLIDLDEPNRLVPGKDYILDVQGRKSKEQADDAAPDPLFRYLDPKIFDDRPTYRLFVALLDNYQPNVCLPEDNTPDETKEALAFLEACMATLPMKFCYSYCKARMKEAMEQSEESSYTNIAKYAFGTEEDFVRLLYKLWFQTYSRSKGCGKSNDDRDGGLDTSSESKAKKVYGSSGFEHVFVGEIRKNKVIGFHNWIQLYRQEQAGNVDYRGTVGKNSNDTILTYNLQWMGSEKPIGSSLIGVSPEFELALYTLLFLLGKKDNVVLVDLGHGGVKAETKLDIKCFRMRGKVGSCYVETIS